MVTTPPLDPDSSSSTSSLVKMAMEAAETSDEDGLERLARDIRNRGGIQYLEARHLALEAIAERVCSHPDSRPTIVTLCHLHCHGIVWFPEVLRRMVQDVRNEVDILEAVSLELLRLLERHDDPSRLTSLKCFSMLICCSFSCGSDHPGPALATSLFDRFLSGYFASSNLVSVFDIVNRCSHLNLETLRSCYSHSIAHFVNEEQGRIPIKDCIGLLGSDGWKKLEEANKARLDIVAEFIEPFQLDDIRSMLSRLLARGSELNYCNFLGLVHLLLQLVQGIETVIFDLTNRTILQSLDEGNHALFIQALLLVRLACQEKRGPQFPSYGVWFQRTFGQETTTLAGKNRKHVQLIRFLTHLVPFEPMSTLRSHLSRPPHVPLVHRQDWSDYVGLARTRLVDLEQKQLDECGADFDVDAVEPVAVSKEVEEDVLNSLKEFQSTGKVPQKVMEASIFRKAFFLGQFVPCLVSLYTSDEDGKSRFIQELVKRGKISKSRLQM